MIYRIEKMCNCLEVSRSGYYAWLKSPSSKRSRENEKLVAEIRVEYAKSRKYYGSPRITDRLKARNILCSENRVARLMRAKGIVAKTRRRFRATTDSKHNLPIAPNILNQNFEVNHPDTVWVADITYIRTEEGWLYLAGILDLFNREIVGWSVNSRINRHLTIDALNKAIIRRSPGQGLIHHSDRGLQYASTDYQAILRDHGIICSMSRKGNCYDNAVMESFFKTLKTELVYQTKFFTREEAKNKLFEYIEIYYNRARIHSALGYKTPAEFGRIQKVS
jgi:putative transposase